MMNKEEGGRNHRGNKGKEEERARDRIFQSDKEVRHTETKQIQEMPWVRGLVYHISRLHAFTV